MRMTPSSGSERRKLIVPAASSSASLPYHAPRLLRQVALLRRGQFVRPLRRQARSCLLRGQAGQLQVHAFTVLLSTELGSCETATPQSNPVSGDLTVATGLIRAGTSDATSRHTAGSQ